VNEGKAVGCSMAGGFAVSELPYSGLISKLCAASTMLPNPSGWRRFVSLRFVRRFTDGF
jgi:hypothetical protein